MPTRWDDILTRGEVQNAALDSSSTIEENPSGVITEAIRDEQRRIREYLGRPVMINRHKQGVSMHDWAEDEQQPSDMQRKYRAWAEVTPVVEVQSPASVSIRFDGDQFSAEGTEPGIIDYHAGFRRRDQDLDDLNGTNSGALTDLTTEPPALPRDIRRTAISLVLFQIIDTEHGKAIGQVEQAVGQAGTITVQGTDTQFVERQLGRIDHYRKSPFL